MLITLAEYKDIFRNVYRFWFRDCVVRERRAFVFIIEPEFTDEQVEEEERLESNPSLRPKGVVTFVRHFEPGHQWSVGYFRSWETIVLGSAVKPLNQSVSVERTAVFPSMDHRVYVTGSGPAYQDESLASMSDKTAKAGIAVTRGAVTRLKQLDGWLYGCGGGRTLFKRLDKGTWESFSQDIPRVPDEQHVGSSEEGFEDFDGWSESDIYAVGGYGDVWHFDGKGWRQIPFPTDEPLKSVCCGGDGQVYISGYEGVTFVGRGDRWKKIFDGGISLGFRDMVWYEDRVWCTSDYGLWTIHEERVCVADVPPTVAACAGHLSVGDGVLLLAGYSGAAFREHGAWQQIVSFHTMETLLDAEAHEGG